jgi:D-psicose/D-tagatose/L-ribulose 3-epimerase
MQLAASNIAWDPADDDVVAKILCERGFKGVEIAPSKRWESPTEATKEQVTEYRDQWSKRGLEVVAMQALLFGRPDLKLFGPSTVREALREYLEALIEIAHGLGARALVFGSPKNRKRGRLPLNEATPIAAEFFRQVGSIAASRGCVLCIEPNPAAYDCDFITTTAEAVALCAMIDSPGVMVNGDAGTIALNAEDPLATIPGAAQSFGHFHASEPFLGEVGEGSVQQLCATALKDCGYTGWVSVEMRAGEGSRPDAIGRAADRVRRLYGP